MRVISAEEIAEAATWPLILEAFRAGHRGKRAALSDTLLTSRERALLVRSAWIDAVAPGVKAVTVFPDNPGASPPKPTVQGPVILFDDADGSVRALLDGPELTKWKTAADSALGADILARRDVETLVMVGAGTMAEPLIRAHLSVRPGIRSIVIWNRSADRARDLATRLADLERPVSVTDNLDEAVATGDVISSATMTRTPLIKGARLKAGAHLDLVGAFRPDMREADDDALTRGRVFVDCFDTTIDEIGEIKIPIERGTITRDDILADFYGLTTGAAGRESDDEITVFKNGGGAHLDILTASAIASAV